MTPRSTVLPVVLLVLAALVAWVPSLAADGFALDDGELIEGNPVVEGTVPWRTAFARDYWHHLGGSGHYRPVAALSLRADRALFGAKVAGYHLTNVLLHVLLLLAAARFLVRAVPDPRPALWGLALFAVHPALADSVAWISGRTSGLAALAGMVGLLGVQAGLALDRAAWRRFAVGLAAATGLLLGLLAKEEAVVFGLAYVLLAWRTSRGEALVAAVASGAGVAIYAVLRHAALGEWSFAGIEAPLASVPLLERLPYAGRALFEALRLAVLPLPHSPSYRAVDGFSPARPPELAALLGWLPWLALVLAGGWALWRRGARSPVALGAASAVLMAAAFLPVLQLVPTAKVFAPRFLHLPLLFGAPFLGLVLVRLARPVRLLLLVGLVPFAWMQGAVYSDRESYEDAVLASVPLDVTAWNNLGLAREERGDLEGAAAAWLRGIEIDPHYSRLWSNLGGHQLRARDYATAAETLRRAVREGPDNAVAHCNLGRALLHLEEDEEAWRVYRRATELAPGMSAAARGLARAGLTTDRIPEARAAVARALELDPADEYAARLRREVDAAARPPERR